MFLFKTHLDLKSYDFWFLIFFYLVKINFFNLDADVAFFKAKIKFIIIILMAMSAFSVPTMRSVCHLCNFRL